jgi:hypothetical protein
MEIYNQLPKELQNKVFYFMSHPCADMIKSSLLWNREDNRCFRMREPNNRADCRVLLILDYEDKNEEWWNNLIEKIRIDRELHSQLKERELMDKNDYDAETGRTVNDDSETEDDSDDDSESSEDNNSDDYESVSSEGNNYDNESVSPDPEPDSDDEYAECADDTELEYLFISEWDEFDHYDPSYAYLD